MYYISLTQIQSVIANPVFIAASLLQTIELQRGKWSTSKSPRFVDEQLEVIRDAADDYAGQTTVEDRNEEPPKIFGVQESPEGTSEAAAASNLIGPQLN